MAREGYIFWCGEIYVVVGRDNMFWEGEIYALVREGIFSVWEIVPCEKESEGLQLCQSISYQKFSDF